MKNFKNIFSDMQKDVVTMLCIACVTFFIASGCGNSNTTLENNGEEDGSIDISFTEYSLAETSCQWKNLRYEGYDGEIIIINSEKKMENYITDCSCPIIDFSKHTLLLVNGLSPNNIEKIKNIVFSKNSANEYNLNIIIHLGVSRVITSWNVSILVPKMTNNSVVKLDVYQSQFIINQ